jgi:hypothetical protein
MLIFKKKRKFLKFNVYLLLFTKVKEKTMVNKKKLLGMLVLILAFGIMLAGCSSLLNLMKPDTTPKTFVKGPAGETTILLRQGLNFDQAFREIAFILNRHGFESEMIQPEVGYIRSRWNKWESTTTLDAGVKPACEYAVKNTSRRLI